MNLEEFVEADDFKVKYFVDSHQYDEMNIVRKDISLSQVNGPTLQFKEAFLSPSIISNPRWNEVFTEIAATRIFWLLGVPADRMYPMRQVVCFGCLSHPKDQKQVSPGKVSIFNTTSIEKKMKGPKLGEGFDLNGAIKDYSNNWSHETRLGLEILAMSSRIIGFHNVIPLQTRLQCSGKKFDEQNRTCSEPIAIIQDTGSSFAAVTDQKTNPRGSLNDYKTEKVFRDEKKCLLFHPYGHEKSNTRFRLKSISNPGLLEMKERLQALTKDTIQQILQIAKFDEMEPKLRDSMPGSTNEEKNQKIISLWTEAVHSRVQEIMNIESCPK